MKATGIIRRIDNLGRVVIPKEICRSMRIKDGDALELYTTDDGEVIFKKYSHLEVVEDLAQQLVESMAKSTDFITAITDRDAIIAVTECAKRDLLGKPITPEVESIMNSRCCYHHDKQNYVYISAPNRYLVTTAVPILSMGEVIGVILCIGDSNKANYDAEYMMAETVSNFLAKQVSL